ncbi:hypothetical protein [Hyphomicrobium sp.]|jgi:hypothetical protein|uniref:hypothetical protein n=1 Tax=Hyphomicrobium sp. TaxID=82 RepID=UPI0035689987
MKSFTIASAVIAAFCFAAALPIEEANAVTASPFAPLLGRWSGIGMIGYKASPPEKIKCRATYLMADAPDEMKQTIRCATAGGNVEIVSNVKEAAGKLAGHWKETIHNFEGDLTGDVTPKGFRVVIKSADVSANMDIIVDNGKQAVEIQFVDSSSLRGITLIMSKG